MNGIEGLLSGVFILAAVVYLLLFIFIISVIAACVKYLFFDKPKAQPEIIVKAEVLEHVIRKQVSDEMVRRGIR